MKYSFVMLVLLLASCTSSIYYVVTPTNFEEIHYQPNKRKLILIDESISSIGSLNTISTLLNKGKWKKLDGNLRSVTDTDSIFLYSIIYMIKQDYRKSYELLNSLSESNFDCQVMLLKTDCLKELYVDSVNYKSAYQEAMNCTRNETIKSIINTRYRFLRYDL